MSNDLQPTPSLPGSDAATAKTSAADAPGLTSPHNASETSGHGAGPESGGESVDRAPKTWRDAVVARWSKVFGRLQTRGFRLIYVMDAVVLFSSMVSISLARWGSDWPTYPLSYYGVGFSIATVVHLVVYYFGGLYEREPRLGYRAWLPRTAGLTLVAIGFDAAIAFATDRYLMPRLNLAALLVAASIGLAANRWVSRRLRSRRFGPARVLLIGGAEDRRLARRHLGDSDATALVVGEVEAAANLLSAVNATSATDVLLLSESSLSDIYPQPLGELTDHHVGVLQRITAREALLGLRRVRQVAGMPFAALRPSTLPPSRQALKRVLELFMVVVTLPFWLTVLALVAIYVRVRAGSEVIYPQTRVGKDSVPFTMLKFRTMVKGAEDATGAVLSTGARDTRVVRGCHILRSMRFDELPQLINVLKGEMSLVGPRPERPELVEGFEAEIPAYCRRHEIAPGLTGLAQVRGGYDTDPAYKLGYDVQYLVNWSPMLDLQILVETGWVILARRL